MKTLATYGLSLLLGLFTASGFAQTAAPTVAEPTASTQSVQAKTVNPNMVNINTATAAEIQDKLVGIGAKKAQAIVEYREKHG
ncbi:ComEA family DNA-binding protein, partial [Glaesserella sp.]